MILALVVQERILPLLAPFAALLAPLAAGVTALFGGLATALTGTLGSVVFPSLLGLGLTLLEIPIAIISALLGGGIGGLVDVFFSFLTEE